MHNPQYSDIAGQVNERLAQCADKYEVAEQVVPQGLRLLLPPGLIGLMLIMMIGAAVSTDNSTFHSWGSIFLQDAVMPFRKKPFTPKQHLFFLRLSITGIAVFAYIFSLTFTLKEYLPMWTFITSSIFIGGAGCAVIGGLYWSRGTTPAAWTSVFIGSTLSVGTIILRQFWDKSEFLMSIMSAEKFPNGLVMSCAITLLSLIAYVTISLLTCKKKCNMDKLLHRGQYAVDEDHSEVELKNKKVSFLAKVLGFTNEFSKADKVIYSLQYAWIWLWIIVFAAGTTYSLMANVPESFWITWWKIHLGIFIFVALVVTVWYTIGGFINLVDLYRTLGTKKIDESDDGMVANKNAD